MAALDPYIPDAAMPWDSIRVRHLYNRVGQGAYKAAIDAGLSMTPSDLIDQIIDSTAALPDPVPPYWSQWTYEDYDNDPDPDLYFTHQMDLKRQWLKEHVTSGFRAKLSRFWHDHFAAEKRVYNCNSWMYSYYDLMQRMCLGNFKDFVRAIGLNPAMLNYLNGDENIADEPNENYARELMELFTMGEGNGYTQDDIVEVARALTGYSMDYCSVDINFNPDDFDNGSKTIFGQTANYNYNSVIDLIFNEKSVEVSTYICGKIYEYFVYDTHDEAVIAEMAQVFRDNNWDLVPVFKALLKSNHFFQSRIINAKIKSPLDMLFQMYNAVDVQLDTELVDGTVNYLYYYSSDNLGMDLFNPPNVAGWPGQRLWINENTLTARWQALRTFFGAAANTATLQNRLRDLALVLGNNTNNPTEITRVLVKYMINEEPSESLVEIATQYFKGDIPQNYFDDGSWSLYWDEAPYQIILLFEFIFKLPEYQLN